MNSEFLIASIIVAFIVGAIIAWFFSKSLSVSTITELRLKLDLAEQASSAIQLKLEDETAVALALTVELNQVKIEKAVLQTRADAQVFSIDELKVELRELKKKDEIVRQEISTAMQAKVIAETSLQDANGSILEIQRRESVLNGELDNLRRQLVGIKEDNATIEANYKSTVTLLQEQQAFVEEAQKNLKDAFGALSAEALKSNNQSFVELAKSKLEEKVTEAKGEFDKKQQAIDSVVKPLAESLTKMDVKINELETKREGAYSGMSVLLDQMKLSTIALDKGTRSLVSALKSSSSRGRYGEIALRRLVEFAGMLEHCDFEEQVSADTENGKLRPDMIIKLPESRRVVVDSKVPLAAYLEVFETEDQEQQKILMDKHVSAIKMHLKQLGSKAYWDQFDDAPDFVVLFMQIESSFGAALQVWPGLIEEALNNRIIVATPTTLITILKSVGYSWNQLRTMENIEAIRDAAVEMYERSATLMEHLSNIGRGLTGTLNHYNKAVGSLENSFLPQGRKINQLAQGYTKKPLPEILPVELTARDIVALPAQITETKEKL